MNVPLRTLRASTSAILRLLLFDVLQSLSTWRWLAVAPVFAATAYLFKSSVAFDPAREIYLDVSPMDLVLAYQVFDRFLLWVVALGFALLVGDLSLRESEHGSRVLSLLRAPSREAWWLARIGAVGLQALLYSAIGLAAIWGVGTYVSQGGHELSPSAFALKSVGQLRTQWASVPAALLLVLTGLYLAWGLWLYGSVLVTTSLLIQRPFVPVVTAVLWLMLCLTSIGPELRGGTALLNIAQLLSYRKHLGEGGMPLGSFFVTTGAALAGVILLGAWRARRVEL